MPTVDFTLEDLKQIFATKDDLSGFAKKDDLRAFATKSDLRAFATKEDLDRFSTRDDIGKVLGEIKKVKEMLEDDVLAEGQRLDRVDRRSLKTQRLLTGHLRDVAASGGR